MPRALQAALRGTIHKEEMGFLHRDLEISPLSQQGKIKEGFCFQKEIL